MESGSVSLSKVLNALLDVAFQVTSADLGSIMYANEDSSELSIRASRGLSAEIINNTRVKFGEGIAGIAAKEKRSFLISDKMDDNRLRPYLTRPNIRTSMVLPISVNNRIRGVMNLGTLKKSTVNFNQETLEVAHKLVDLATLALQG
jgi:GAF domain-containing protein